MGDLTVDKSTSLVTAGGERRSTRVCRSLAVSISGQNWVGSSVSEFTSAISENCHGCLCRSSHHYRPGSWITLEIRSQQGSGKLPRTRAQVKFVATPQSPAELYRVGVEFETPSNIWGIDAPPDDWLQFSVALNFVADTPRAVVSGPADQSNVRAEVELRALPQTMDIELSHPAVSSMAEYIQHGLPALSADHMLAALNEKLQRTAETAVASAVAFHVNRALRQAEQTIERFTKASVLKVEEHELLCGQDLITLARGEMLDLLSGLQADITQSQEELRKEFASSMSEAHKAVQGLEQNAADLRALQSEALDTLRTTARELHGQLPMQVREAVDKANADSHAQTIAVSHRPFVSTSLPSAMMLKKPVNGSNLARTEIISAHAGEEEAAGRPIAVIGTRGGVGTSTIAVNLGVQLAQIPSKKTVLLDFSRPLGSVSLLLDVEPPYRLGDAIANLDRLDSSLLAGLLTHHKSGLEILAGALEPEEWQYISISSLDRLVQVVLRNFDFAVIDFGSMYSTECSTIVDLAEILLATQADVPGLANLGRHLSALYGLKVPNERIKIIVNRWHPEDDQSLATIETSLKRPIFARLPNDFHQVREAITTGTPFSTNRPNPLVTAFRELAQKLSGSAQIQQSKRRSLLGFLGGNK